MFCDLCDRYIPTEYAARNGLCPHCRRDCKNGEKIVGGAVVGGIVGGPLGAVAGGILGKLLGD